MLQLPPSPQDTPRPPAGVDPHLHAGGLRAAVAAAALQQLGQGANVGLKHGGVGLFHARQQYEQSRDRAGARPLVLQSLELALQDRGGHFRELHDCLYRLEGASARLEVLQKRGEFRMRPCLCSRGDDGGGAVMYLSIWML